LRQDPFGEGSQRWTPHDVYGRIFTTDADGRLEVRFDGPRHVCVWPLWGMGVKTKEKEPTHWYDTPVPDLTIVVGRAPTATVVVTVVDAATGEGLRGFACTFSVRTTGVHMQKVSTEGAVLEAVIEIPSEGAKVYANLTTPGAIEPKELFLRPKDRVEIEFRAERPDRVTGVVVAADGKAIEGAYVFFGDETAARGNDPFKPFQAKRIPHAARTDANGQFDLAGDGVEVTVWHAAHSSVTVARDATNRVVLPPRGSIRGRLVDAERRPQPGVEVTLDHARAVTTDADGAFSFDGVEAGVRGVLLPDKRWYAVRVAPGEAADIELRPGIAEVEIEILSGGEPFLEPILYGGLIGEAKVASVVDVRPVDGRARVAGVLAGRYLFLGHGGRIGHVEITGPRAVVDVGRARVRIGKGRAPEAFIAPQGADPLVLLLCAKTCRVLPSDSGEALCGPLAAGDYVVCFRGKPGRLAVRVPATGEVTADQEQGR
jgi:hypothetical protein